MAFEPHRTAGMLTSGLARNTVLFSNPTGEDGTTLGVVTHDFLQPAARLGYATPTGVTALGTASNIFTAMDAATRTTASALTLGVVTHDFLQPASHLGYATPTGVAATGSASNVFTAMDAATRTTASALGATGPMLAFEPHRTAGMLTSELARDTVLFSNPTREDGIALGVVTHDFLQPASHLGYATPTGVAAMGTARNIFTAMDAATRTTASALTLGVVTHDFLQSASHLGYATPTGVAAMGSASNVFTAMDAAMGPMSDFESHRTAGVLTTGLARGAVHFSDTSRFGDQITLGGVTEDFVRPTSHLAATPTGIAVMRFPSNIFTQHDLRSFSPSQVEQVREEHIARREVVEPRTTPHSQRPRRPAPQPQALCMLCEQPLETSPMHEATGFFEVEPCVACFEKFLLKVLGPSVPTLATSGDGSAGDGVRRGLLRLVRSTKK